MLSTYAVLMSESWRGPAIVLHSEHLGCYFNWKNLTVFEMDVVHRLWLWPGAQLQMAGPGAPQFDVTSQRQFGNLTLHPPTVAKLLRHM